MKKFLLAVILLGLFSANVFWFIYTSRIDSRVSYHATHICELDRLITLKEQLPLGSGLKAIKRLCNSDRFRCDWYKGTVSIDYDNLVDCPYSGRPYCGYVATMNKNKITSIIPGYPCH